MRSFRFVEDYIEFIAGAIDIEGTRISTTMFYTSPVLSLARYDVAPIESFALQIYQTIGFTDRQSGLALRLLGKYEKQLKQIGVSIEQIMSNPQYKFPLRHVDRTKELKLAGDSLELRFPYDTALIDEMRKFEKVSQGRVKYNSDKKLWYLALTESCVNFAVAFANANKFNIDPTVAKIAEDIIEMENQEYQIQLQINHECNILEIVNAPKSLIEYVENYLGGFEISNLGTLIDYSSILEYSVHPDLVRALPDYDLVCSNEFRIMTGSSRLNDLVNYARAYHRFPIISYSTQESLVKTNTDLDEFFDESEVVTFYRNKPDKEITETTKLIHISGKAAREWNSRIPLLVCYTNMMFGAEKLILLQNAEKVCYYCDAFYKKE